MISKIYGGEKRWVHAHTGVAAHRIGPRDARMVARVPGCRPSPCREQGRTWAWIGLDASVDAGEGREGEAHRPRLSGTPIR
jgi:hypothetical protein